MPVVFHPDLPTPSPAVTKNNPTYTLSDVAAHGVDAPAGNIFVCVGSSHGGTNTLSQPRLCYVSIDSQNEGVADSTPNQFSHLPSYHSIAKVATSATITIHTIIRGRAASPPTEWVDDHPKQPPSQANTVKVERAPFTTSTFVNKNKFVTSKAISQPRSSSVAQRPRANSANDQRKKRTPSATFGLMTAVRAHSRARQDAQFNYLPQPNMAANGSKAKEFRSLVDTQRNRAWLGDSNRKLLAADGPAKLVIRLPCQRVQLNPTSILFRAVEPNPMNEHEEIVLTFTNPHTFSTFVSVIDALEARGNTSPVASSTPRALASTRANGDITIVESPSRLRDRLTTSRFKFLGNDRRPFSADRYTNEEWAPNLIDREDDAALMERISTKPYLDGRLAGSSIDEGYLDVGGRPMPESALQSSSIPMLTPAQRRDRHWRVQAAFDGAREAYLNFEDARRRDIERIFEERDRRREAFMRKRFLLHEELEVPKDILTNVQTNEVEGHERDANWDTFAFMADAIGRKWEQGGNYIDQLLGVEGAGHHPPGMPLHDMPSSPLRQMSPDAIMKGLSATISYPPEGDVTQQEHASLSGPLFAGPIPVVGPASATLNALHQHPLELASNPLNRSESAATSGGVSSAIERLRASRQASIIRSHSTADLQAGTSVAAVDNTTLSVPAEDPIQAALRAEARLLKTVHTKLPAPPATPPLTPPAQTQTQKTDPSPSTTQVETKPPLVPASPSMVPQTPPTPPATQKAPSPKPSTIIPTVIPQDNTELPLPAGWKEGKSEQGKVFYWNTITKERSWTRPTPVSQSAVASPASPPAAPISPLPSGWKEATDPKTGKVYYYNTSTKQTTRERPTTSGDTPSGALKVPPPPAGQTLPAGWKEEKAPNGRSYYFNVATKERLWTLPTI